MSNKRLILFMSAVILLSIFVKLYYAYICSFYIYHETAIMGLAAKQVLKGEFMVFFYGTLYTWVIESWFIALCFILFGISNYTIYLGPIFVSILFLVSVYFLGKQLKNRETGIFALIYSAFPAFYFFKYSVIPTGYLAELPFFGNIILLLTLKIVNTVSRRRGFLYFIILGFVSALCFWLHYLSLYYLSVAAVFLFINMIRAKKIKYYFSGGTVSLLSFFLGGLPCWLFNFRHDFICFKFPKIPNQPGFLFGFKKFTTYQMPGILGNDIIGIAIFVLALIYFVYNIRKTWFFILFFISIILLYSSGGEFTKNPDHRYIMPVFSLVPIVLAYFLDWINTKKKLLAGGILSILILINISNIGNGILKDRYKFIAAGRQWDELLNFFNRYGIAGVYGEGNTINFISHGKVFAGEILNSSNPLDTEVQYADRIAYLGAKELIPAFDILCKSYKNTQVNRVSVFYDFKPWGYYGREILPVGWKARSNYNSGSVNRAFDRNLDRFWSSITNQKTGMYYEIEFPIAYKVFKLQIFNIPSDDLHLPEAYRILVSKDGVRWDLIQETNSAHPMFWSGPQVVWRLVDTRLEIIFSPVEARFLRIEQIGEDKYPWEINEIIVYEYEEDRNFRIRDYVKEAKGIYEFLGRKGINFVYADYWLSAKIKVWSNRKIETLDIFNEFWPDRKNISRMINLNKKTAVVVEKPNERQTDRILTEYELPYYKKIFGEYVCYYFLPETEKDKYFLDNIKSLHWIGTGVSRINLRAFGKLLMEYGDYLKAVRYFPLNPNLRYKLLDIYKKDGQWGLYKKEKQFIRHRFNPSIKKEIQFDGGVEFLGLGLERISSDKARINYLWRLKENLKWKVFAFVHFIKDGKMVFQNDHPLLEQYARLPILQPGEVWKESYIIKIPTNIPKGEYSIKLGLWLPGADRSRLKIAGSKKTSITIGPVVIDNNKLLRNFNGRIVFQNDITGNKELYIIDANGANIKKITSTDKDSSYANWSPDGKDIVFMSNRDGNNEIYIMKSGGENLRNLTNNPADDISPSWHPDGERIIFVSDRDNAMNFYIMNKDGASVEKITDFKDGVHDMPRISPDGKEIIFTSNMSMGWQLFKIDIDGGNLQRISSQLSGHCEGIWSHNGDKILFVMRFGDGNSDIRIMDRDGSNEQKLTTDPALDYNPRFSPDDKKIIFISERHGNWELYIMDINDKKPIRLTYTDTKEEWADWENTD